MYTKHWRLQVHLGNVDSAKLLANLCAHESADVAGDESGAIWHEIALEHDGSQLFAYARTKDEIRAARRAIASMVRLSGYETEIFVSYWNSDLDGWHRTDLPLAAPRDRVTTQSHMGDLRSAYTPETQTLICHTGKLANGPLEARMTACADRLHIDCKFIRHLHLQSTHVALTVTGQRGTVEKFKQELWAGHLGTIRVDGALCAPHLRLA